MKIAKWGNSLGVRIPKDVAKALGLKEGDEIEIVASEQGLLGLATKMSRDEALARLDDYRGWLPAGYRFDRDEANAR